MKRMEIKMRFAAGIIVLWATGCLAQSVTDLNGNTMSSHLDAGDQQTQAKDLAGKRGQQQVDLFTGSFGYSIPIGCAPARNGSEPNLALVYSSGGNNDWCGMGWKLDIGFIERNAKEGFPIKYSTGNPPAPLKAYDDSKGFMLNLFGKEIKLLPTGTPNEYDPEVDTDFLRCICDTNNNQWLVYDKSGAVYYFGQVAGSRMTNPKSGWSGFSGTYHWALDQIDTATGDRTTITYTNYNDPDNASVPEKTLYPTQITYNGHADINGYHASYTGSHTISFGTELRPDRRISYRDGFRTEQNRRLTNIVCKVGSQQVWRYALHYTASAATGRSLLTSLNVYGADDTTALPTQTFTYQQNPNAVSFGPTIRWDNLNLHTPGTTSGSYEPYVTQVNQYGGTFNYAVADLIDIDGDGLPDRVNYDASTTPNQYRVQKNLGLQANGNGLFGATNAFGPTSTGGGGTASDSNPLPDGNLSGGSGYAEFNTPDGRIRDINGDGLPDRVMGYWKSINSVTAGTLPYTPFTNYEVQINLGNGFSGVTAWPVSAGPLAPNTYDSAYYYAVESGGVNVGFMDINGDGRPDRIMSGWYQQGAMTNFMVQYNTGTNFTQSMIFGPYYSQNYNGTSQTYQYNWAGIETPEAHMIDINGDGLPDRLMFPMNPSSAGNEVSYPATYYAVEYNDGYSFESTNTSTGAGGAADKWPGVATETPNGGIRFDAMQNPPYTGLFDLNGDGLPDRVMVNWTNSNFSHSQWLVYLNNGKGFNTSPVVVTNIENQGQYSQSYTPDWWTMQNSYYGSSLVSMIDINGDGLLDRVMSVYDNGYNNANSTSNYFLVQLNLGPYPDLLTNIDNGLGGTLGVTYKPSTAYDNRKDQNDANSSSVCPFPMQTVATLTESDGINAARTTSYGYMGGYYDGTRREFHGFAVVTVTNPPSPISTPYNRRTVHYFHQGGGQSRTNLGEYLDPGNFAKDGMEYRVETYGGDNKLYNVVVKQVNQASLGNGRYFPFTQLKFSCDYPGDGTPRVTATALSYDTSTGNMTNEVDYGEVTGFNPTNTGSFSFADANASDTQYHATHYASISGNSYILDHADDVSFTDGSGNVVRETKYTFNSQSGTLATKEVRISSGHYATNSYSDYNSYGLVGTTTDPVGVQTSITYDSTYNTYPATTTVGSLTTSKTYDARSGLVTSSTDYAGITMTNLYDALFRMTESDKISVGGGSQTWVKKFGYPSTLKPIKSGVATNYFDVADNDGVGGFTNRTYVDGFERSIQTRAQGENGNYRVITTVYDERGIAFITTWPQFESAIGYTKPATQTAAWTGFDAAGRAATNRLVTATFSSGVFTSKSDLSGDGTSSPLGAHVLSYVNGSDPWWVVSTDADGKVCKYQLDAFGRTNQILEVDGSSTYTNTLSYDLAGDLTDIINSQGQHIYYAYNDVGEKVAMADPSLGQWEYVRDYAGRLRQQTDGRGDVIKLSYVNPSSGQQDPLGRVQTKEIYLFNDTNQTLTAVFTNTYTYDSGDTGFTVYPGLLYKTTDSEGWQKNGYDARGRIIKTVRHLNIINRDYTNSYTYNDGDYVTSTVYPNSGPTITNTYFHGGSLNTVSRTGGSAYYTASASAYDQFGHVTNFVYGNGLTTTRSYYSVSKRLQSISTGSGGSVFSRTFTYTKEADIASLSGTGLTNTMNVTYDDLHRIKTYGNLSGSYGYDSAGNITTNIESGVSVVYDYGVRRQQAVKTVDGKKYLYDLCGNMIVRNGGSTSQQSLEYDAENRLVRVAEAGTNFMLVKFGYSGDGTRLWKWNNQNPTNLQVWIGNNYEEKGGKTLFHVYAGGVQVCTFEAGSPLAGGSDTNKVGEYYHQDNLNSSSALSDSAGGQSEVNAYYPFGRTETASPQADFQVSRRFTGQVFDKETGLYYYNARYYDPELGRFVQADTEIPDLSDPQSYNRYSYVLNNPLRFNDPTGHGYWGDVAGYFMGYYDVGKGLVVSAVKAHPFYIASHPIETWHRTLNTVSAITHPIDTGKAIANGIKADWNGDARAHGRLVGGTLLVVGTALAPGAEASNLSKVGQVAGVGEKAAATAGDAAAAAKEQYYIENGVRRSVASREAGADEIPATIFREGQSPENTTLQLDQLHSPKPEIEADPRYENIKPPIQTPIQVQPKGVPGQLPTVPLNKVKIVPPGGE